MQVRAILLAGALALAAPVARAADLVVWWEEGFAPGEDDAVREMMAAFEGKAGKTVELTFLPQDVLPDRLQAALDAGEPPDFAFGTSATSNLVPWWAREGRLVELSAALGPLAELIDEDALAHATLPNERTGREGLYAMPVTRSTQHVHVWKGLLERAGFTLADVPKEWGPFWSFWCGRSSRRSARRRDGTTYSASVSRCPLRRPTTPTRSWSSSPTRSRGTGRSPGARA